ncbi:MAG: hypothetical protein K2Z81_27895, partial [Cyanobacteria bacterium]|nr:hypothetical protein [Cyanobacteriota bacterium]
MPRSDPTSGYSNEADSSGNASFHPAAAEVLRATITGFTAECCAVEPGSSLVYRPRFGSFLRVDSQETDLQIYGVVYNVVTGPQDNVHKPSALGMTRKQL